MFHTSCVRFTLEDIQNSAWHVLDMVPDGVLAYRLMGEVLRLPPADPEMVRMKGVAMNSRWVRQLEEAQLPDGSWGRFHSQDTKVKTVFRTTEEAIDRAYALGLDRYVKPIAWVHQYILDILHGDAHITDWDEKKPSWPLVIKLILAGRLAQIDPISQELDSFWQYMSDVARQAFTSKKYNLEDEVAAFQRLSGVHVPQGFLESEHTLWILASRKLPESLEHAIVNWIWYKPDGIRYLRVPLADPSLRLIGYWLRSMNILSRFSSWREVSLGMLNQLWERRGQDGLWDFGTDIVKSVDFPLSDNWRQVKNRKLDYSTCVLTLLRKYFD